ncbi:MAG TPA: zinc metalloprotease HtpX [Gaiellaceae bacterium]|jgi:heat shock protein HtpX|nr:zinc metalloprotease HtpX [Gaiellaceae bacterium]
MRRKAYGRDFGLTSRMFLTIFLLGALYVGFFALLLQSGASIGVMVVILGVFAFVQYFTSDKIALASSGAKVVTPEQAPDLHAMVDRLCAMSDLPKPRVAVIPTDVPNAFATGRSPKRSVVAVTEGLWKRLDPPEIEGVIAHELAHIANRDVAVMTFASFFSNVASLLIWFGGGLGRNREGPPIWLIALVVYFVSYFLILALSRYREFAADRGAALVTGAPENLMSALQKIASDMTRIPQRDLRQMESLNAFYIIPTNVKRSAATLFMTHPPLEKRLARLAAIAQEMGKPVSY